MGGYCSTHGPGSGGGVGGEVLTVHIDLVVGVGWGVRS